MVSESVEGQIDRLLDDAEEVSAQRDREVGRDKAIGRHAVQPKVAI